MKAITSGEGSSPKSSFHCFEIKEAVFQCPFHFHAAFEITHILSSYGRRFVGNTVDTFEPGDLIFLGSDVAHMYYNDPKESLSPTWAHAHVVQFEEKYLGKKLLSSPDLSGVVQLLERSQSGLRFFGDTRRDAAKVMKVLLTAKGPKRLHLFIDLMEILSDSDEFEELNANNSPIKLNNPDTESQFNKVCEFINQNFSSNFSQSTIAETIDMTSSAFSRFFRKTSGKPFVQFINEVRLEHACRLLRETDISVMEIGYQCGFGNLSNFNRRFKNKLNMTPLKYRQNYILKGVWRNNEQNKLPKVRQ